MSTASTDSRVPRSTSSALLLAFCFALPTAQAGDWIPLFNGKDMTSWQHVGPGRFVVKNGLLETQGGMGLLWYTAQKFADVRLKVVFKGSLESNSGVFIRIPEKPTEPWMPVNKGYEVQIDYTEDDAHATGVLYSLTRALAKPPRKDDWNELLITLDGPRTRVEVNGVLVTDYREGDAVPKKAQEYEPDRGPRPLSGYIGLQNHSDRDTIFFKEISYQPLGR